MGISYSAAFVLIDDPPNQQLFLPDEDKIIANTEHLLSPHVTCIHTI